MNVNNVKLQIKNDKKAQRKSASDLRIINDTLKEGCPNCKLRPKETHQNQLPALPEQLLVPEQLLANNLQVDFAMPGPAPKPTPKPQ